MTLFPNFSHSSQPTHSTGNDAASNIPASPMPDGDHENGKWFGKRPGGISLAALTRKATHTQETPSTSPTGSSAPNFKPIENAGPNVVDPSRLSEFSLRLNELVNKAFVSTKTSHAPSTPITTTSPFTGTIISLPRLQTISYESNHLPDRVKVIEMTRLVINELHTAAAVDPYFLRAVARSVVKSVSQFVVRIEALIVPVNRGPNVLFIPAHGKAAQHLPAAMEFNLALMSFEWIVEESLERCLDGLPPLALLSSPNILVPTTSEGQAMPRMPPFVHEILSPLQEQMEASIIHVVQPVLVQIKSGLAACIARGNPRPFEPQRASSEMPYPEFSEYASYGRNAPHVPWLKELEDRLDGAYRLLSLRIVERCGQDGHAWFISVATHTIWKGLLSITARSVFAPTSVVESQFSHTFGPTPNNSDSSAILNSLLSGEPMQNKRVPTPTQLAHALRMVGKPHSHRFRKNPGESFTGTHTPAESALPSVAFDGWKSHFMLPADESVCYVVNPLLIAEQLHDLQVFERLMKQFCSHLLYPEEAKKPGRFGSRARKHSGSDSDPGKTEHRPSSAQEYAEGDASSEEAHEAGHGDEDLALAALREAFEAMRSTVIVLRTLLQEPDSLQHLAMVTRQKSNSSEHLLSSAAHHAFNVIPPLLLIQIAYCRIPPIWSGRNAQCDCDLLLEAPPSVFGRTWSEYDAALPGFAAGEAAAESLAHLYGPVLARTFSALVDQCADADPCVLHDTDTASLRSVSSNETEQLNIMTRSAPALENLSLSEMDSGLNTRSTGPENHASNITKQLQAQGRSRSMHRTAVSNRFWRRNSSQGSQHGQVPHPHALPPRISRAHATTGPHRHLRGSKQRDSSPPSSSLPRSTTYTLAQMQRNALNMFDSVLFRVNRTFGRSGGVP
ncbi:hypothetical protein MVES1_002953 [Malassezia vespertilionis]|uniref:Uncharacterized protein n=1 Tax=Malassezia vespertilionis TaxID=2020962 RepID=A0A2N1J9S0_9BASI|nr:uncharacterized protein MVES1_002953 [Malassezia vespertilionis]PKI83303.1 hypothetical protein MVES_002801 [Malassezia vespertilionis]WFD07586.1 hypothetical protein MVES1_002953 [Malassezia vespertilionis]